MRASSHRPPVVALGIWLLWHRPVVLAALVLAILGAIAAGVLTVQAGGGGALHAPALAAIVASWSVGIMVAFGGALRAVPRDAQDGVIALVCARGVRTRAYAYGRMFGLAWVVGTAIVLVTLVAGICAASVSTAVLPVLKATCAALAYGVAFAATMGPLAMAALGQRSRAAGYLSFLAVLVLPEVAASLTAATLPAGWHELTSIPAALDAVRTGIESPRANGLHATRAIAILVAIVAISWAIVGSRAAREQARWPA